MKEQLNLWLSQQARLSGALACAVRYPDCSTFSQPWAERLPAEALERSLASLSDLWRLLRLSGIQSQWVRAAFAGAWFYAAQRADGTFLGLVTARNETADVPEDITTLIRCFLSGLPVAPRTKSPPALDRSSA
jgi:hypothetical protein